MKQKTKKSDKNGGIIIKKHNACFGQMKELINALAQIYGLNCIKVNYIA